MNPEPRPKRRRDTRPPTHRETQALKMVADGYSHAAVAERYGVQVSTVGNWVRQARGFEERRSGDEKGNQAP